MDQIYDDFSIAQYQAYSNSSQKCKTQSPFLTNLTNNHFIGNLRTPTEGGLIHIHQTYPLHIDHLFIEENQELSLRASIDFWLHHSGVHASTLYPESPHLNWDSFLPKEASYGSSMVTIWGAQSSYLSNFNFVNNSYSSEEYPKYGHLLHFSFMKHSLLQNFQIQQPWQQFFRIANNTTPMTWGSLISLQNTNLTLSKGEVNNLVLQGSLVEASQEIKMKNINLFNCSMNQLVSTSSVQVSLLMEDNNFQNILSPGLLGASSLSIRRSVFNNSGLDMGEMFSFYRSSQYSQELNITDCWFIEMSGLSLRQYTLFTLEDNVQVVISNSTFLGNKFNELSVLEVGGQSQVYIDNSNFIQNRGKFGGVFLLVEQGTLTLLNSQFDRNAGEAGGVIHFIGSTSLTINSNIFKLNYAHKGGSVIDGISEECSDPYSYGSFKIENSQFVQNIGHNTFNIYFAQLLIRNCTFLGNKNEINNPSPLNFTFTTTLIDHCSFNNSAYPQLCHSISESSWGGFIFDKADNQLKIHNSIFERGCSQLGGVIASGGLSTVEIHSSRFIRNVAYFAAVLSYERFNALTVTNCTFEENEGGTIIDSLEMMNTFTLKDSRFKRETADNVLYIERTPSLILNSSFSTFRTYQNIGTVLSILLPLQIEISDCTFENWNKLGAISISKHHPFYNAYSTRNIVIYRNTFKSIESEGDGGAIRLTNLQFIPVTISQNSFQSSSSKQRGGGLFVDQKSQNNPITVRDNSFSNCRANTGGAIQWVAHRPIMRANHYSNNSAQIYGQNQASYPIKLSIIDGTQNPLFLQQLWVTSKSGFEFPEVQIALFDVNDQVVSSWNSNHFYVSKISSLDQSPFRPLIDKRSQAIFQEGKVTVNNITLIGGPGSNVELQIMSSAIDQLLPDVKYFHNSGNTSHVSVLVQLKLCEVGDGFLSTGQCRRCQPGTYLLIAPREPTQCKKCPQKAKCFGGNLIAPKQGYWRSGELSLNFIPCFNPEACQEVQTEQEYTVNGKCKIGYRGTLCGECEENYTRNHRFSCAQCPDLVSNVIIITALTLVFSTCIVLLVWQVWLHLSITLKSSQKKQSTFSIFFKIFINHLQLLSLVSSFKLEWPSAIRKFFDSSSTVADIPRQLFSFDCLMQMNGFSRFYPYLLFYFFLPLICIALCCCFWRVCKRKARNRQGKLVSSILILFFMIHPTVTNVMFQSFQQVILMLSCVDIDGQQYLKEDLSQKCWEGKHLIFSLGAGLPGLLFWTFGLPALFLLLLYDERKNLQLKKVRETYGFLYNGYHLRGYYWDSVIMFRKIIVAFISIFLTSQGTLTQALVLFLVMIIFIAVTLNVRPFYISFLNTLEVISFLALIITAYCGIFYLSSKSSSSTSFTYGVDFTLSEPAKWFFFTVIILSNCIFLLLFLWRFFTELRTSLRQNFRRFYICCCLCSNKRMYEEEVRVYKDIKKNQLLITEIENAIQELQNIKRLYTRGITFPDRNHFQEILHRLTNELGKLNKSKKEAKFIPIHQVHSRLEDLPPEKELNIREMLDMNSDKSNAVIEFQE